MEKQFLRILFTLILFFSAGSLAAQAPVDRSEAPAAGPTPEINIGVPVSFETDNGIHVFVVENHKVPKVNVSLILKKDPIREYDKVGYTGMSGSMMRRGTDSMKKEELDEAIDFLGGSVYTGSSGAGASALTKNFEAIFKLFSDVILHPSFEESELEKVKKRALSALEADKEDPDAILRNVSTKANFGQDHPYGEVEKPENINNITRQDLVDYYRRFWKPNITYMAFVGDITPQKAEELVRTYLGEWEKGEVTNSTFETSERPEKNEIYIADRPSAVQTNVGITYPIDLKPGAKDYFPLTLMNQILGGGVDGWLFQDLREKYGFTYGAYSSIRSDPLVGSFRASASVRTPVTDSALMRFMYQLNRMHKEEVTTAKLDSAKNVVSGGFALSLEHPSQIAQFALNIARYDLPKDYYQTYLQKMDAVTPEEIKSVATRYLTPEKSNIILVGNAGEFLEEVKKYGTVRFVDIYGDPVSKEEGTESE